MSKPTKPFVNSAIFRDVDVSKLDYIKAKLYIIDRILNYGTLDDFLALL